MTSIRREFMTVWMMAADLIALALAGVLAVVMRLWVGEGFYTPAAYFELGPLLFIFVLVYAISGLYPGVGIGPVDELRRLTGTTSAVLVVIATVLFLTQQGISYSRLIFLLFWAFSLVAVPLSRLVARRIGLGLKVWGEPVALVGFGEQGRKVLANLRRDHLSGLIPILIVDGIEKQDSPSADTPQLPLIHAEELVRDKLLLRRMGIQTIVLVPPETPDVLRDVIVNEDEFGIRRLILISSLGWMGGSAMVPYDLHGVLGLEVERNLLNPGDRLLKRLMDVGLVLMGSVVVLPVIAICAVMIRLDSRGPVFYCQKRMGRLGKQIRVWKFRTMIPNADQVLEDCLNCDPELQAEWEASHKLKNDPRITRIGSFLRKTSLDELPQIWNVVLGEMSLVGPRPIVQDEVKHYRGSYRLYTQVLPGITGMWQVSGRSDTSYDYRVELDEYYIRHWSIWMDIYVLMRTIWSVLKRSGAY